MCLYIDAAEHELGDLGEPVNYKATLLDPESDKWLNAMNVEMQPMKDNEVWDLVDLPPNGKTIGSKWLFKKKTDMDGVVHTYKARVVAKGYTQTLGINYEETFSLVADIRAIRILIAIIAFYNYEVQKMDVKIAFLNGYLSEEVYMEHPEGFINPKYPKRVCKLKHSIYGLKQASRQWNKRFDDEIKKFGFTQNHDEPCVYLKASGSNVIFLILYVDDILIMGNNIPMLQDVKSYLERCFAMKDLGEASYILGIKIYRDRSRRLIGLCQSAYIEKILKRYHVENSKRGSIPMQEKLRLSKSQGASTPTGLKHIQNVPYASTVSSIMNTKDMFLVYGGDLKQELRVSCYTDAGYIMNVDDLKSQTGCVFVLNGGAVDWKSAKQSIFATSSAEAEYIAAYDASKEAVWVRKFIFGLGSNESGITKGARHFRAKVHCLREVIEFGDIKLEKVHTDDNLADPFTKALAFSKHSKHTRNIEMLPASSFMQMNPGDGGIRMKYYNTILDSSRPNMDGLDISEWIGPSTVPKMNNGISVQSCLVLLEKESVVLEEDTKPDYEQENMSVFQRTRLQIQEQERQIQELQLRIQEQQVQIQEQQQQIQEQQQHIQELIQELQEQQIQELDDEKVEGEYYHFIDRNFYRIKELKISGLAKKAGVGENLIIEEVDYYMKDKWNSFSPDLQAFLQEESNSQVPAYNKDQLYQIVNFIHITRDIYTAEMTEKISYLGRSEQLDIATAYRDLIKSVKKMIEDEEANITAVDVVNFGIQDHNRSGRKNTLLQAFVAAVNNGRYLYAPTGSHKSLAKNLSRSLIMPRVDGEGSASCFRGGHNTRTRKYLRIRRLFPRVQRPKLLYSRTRQSDLKDYGKVE
ncbi:retrotransposon protein, putative, ty1-copia subclass [Tanacetum coccineum]